MEDDDPTLILTRPADRAQAFLALCEARLGRRIPAIISPVIEIVPFGDIPDLTEFDTLIVTSASAVSRLADEGLLGGRRVATVGERTAALAKSSGASATCLGENVETFLERVDQLSGPCLHLRGVHSRGDLALNVSKAGVPCAEAVIYDQIQRPLSSAARSAIAGQGRAILPLFSPRTAELLSSAAEAGTNASIIAMSDAVAAAWRGGGDVKIAQEPTNDAMCDMVIAAF